MKISQLIDRFIPFLILGIVIALGIALFFLFIHVLIWGLLIGALLFVIKVIKDHFFGSDKKKATKSGRIIEHDDHQDE